MRVFISWSKEPSRTVADALRDWLPDVIQSLDPWMSSADIGAGARWSAKIAETLASTKIGILCVTPDNQREPWLLFEAGALAKTLEDTFVCPYLIQMRAADLAPGPLTQFQAKLADQDGTYDLLSTVNAALGSEALPSDRLRRLFERSWPHLEARLKTLPTSPQSTHRTPEEVLTEILETVRSLARRLPTPSPPASPEQDARQRRIAMEFRARHYLQRMAPQVSRREIAMRLRQMPATELEKLWVTLRGRPKPGPDLPDFLVQLLTSSAPAATPQGAELHGASDVSTQGSDHISPTG
jgi:TIR domain